MSAGIIPSLPERSDEAELLGVRRLATRDIRHFAAIRLRDGSAFELVVYPLQPDES
jgi:hypothetical protein